MGDEAAAVFDVGFRHTIGDRERLLDVGLDVCTTCGNVHHKQADCPVCRLVDVLDPLGAFEYLDEEWDH